MTTRSTRVASIMEIDSPYIVEGLKDDESWELFVDLAFKKGEEKMHPNLIAIGKDIVKMCNGVPLVIETIGRILYFQTQESQWLNIKNNRSLMLLGDRENDINSVLRLSYDNLPIHLKQCFAYCALFPKDHMIERKLLVQLWMAQGYIQPSHENYECLEDVGDEYFEDLLTRSLFQVVEGKDMYGDAILYYKMHDLIHNLAQSVVKSDILMLTNDVQTIPERVHHVSVFRATDIMPKDLMDKPIRTVFVECESTDEHDITKKNISSLKCLRVMKMSLEQQKLLASLAKLSHLRYLDLSGGSFENLPSDITRLKQLQTLKLNRCFKLKELPGNMKKLINLRHLEIDRFNKLTYMPCGLGELTQLQSLPFFWVGMNESDSGKVSWHKKRSMGGGLSELKFLNNLRGRLQINGLSNAATRGSREANKEANLVSKQYLERLTLNWSQQEATEVSGETVFVIESLKPHPNLKELVIYYYGGERFPNWMINDGLHLLLPNLVTIRLRDCKRCQVLPPFGQLPSLQYLQLWSLEAVEYMKDDYHRLSVANPFFPSLKSLEICNMPSLRRWGKRDKAADQAPSYPYLEDLSLTNICKELCLRLMCVSSSLKSLYISDVKDLISLPHGLQHISTLQTLTIQNCYHLATLPDWIGLLTSLTKLTMYQCPKLTSLPEGMRSLHNLHTLQIIGCQGLHGICHKETAKDWHKISHIPNIFVRLYH